MLVGKSYRKKSVYNRTLWFYNGPSPELPLPLSKKGAFHFFHCVLVAHHGCMYWTAIPSLSSIYPFWWWKTWLAFVYIWYMLCVVCLRLLPPPLPPITEIQSLATSLVDVISYFFSSFLFSHRFYWNLEKNWFQCLHKIVQELILHAIWLRVAISLLCLRLMTVYLYTGSIFGNILR